MILMHAMLELELVEHGSANPFVALVSAIEFRTSQLKGMPLSSPLAKESAVSQLENLLKILGSVKKLVVPESNIRSNLNTAVPLAEKHINGAIDAVKKGDMIEVFSNLNAASSELIKYSHLTFQ